LVKVYRTVSTQLPPDKYDKLIKICTERSCKPFGILRDLLIDFLDNYEEVEKTEHGKEAGQAGDSRKAEDNPDNRQPQGNDRASHTDTAETNGRESSGLGDQLIEVQG